MPSSVATTYQIAPSFDLLFPNERIFPFAGAGYPFFGTISAEALSKDLGGSRKERRVFDERFGPEGVE